MMRQGVHFFCGLLLATCLAALLPGTVQGQPIGPPPPKEYQVEIRYRIRASLNERVTQFRALVHYLESIGFQKNPGPEDEADNPDVTTMTGTIASANARKILGDRHVEAVLLLPAGYQTPTGADDRVKVNLGLAQIFTPERQRLLATQTVSLLEPLGFRQAIGYDDRHYTRVVGTIPADELRRLMSDLRWQSSGWLTPEVPVAALPPPIQNTWPLQIIEVVPEPEGIAPIKELPAPPPVPPDQAYLLKIAPDLRALAGQDQTVLMEALLASPPSEIDFGWERLLAMAAGGTVEGRLGSIVVLRAPAKNAAGLARLPGVLSVRLPRTARHQPVAGNQTANVPDALRAVGVERYHSLGQRGRGVRVAVIDDDFRGYQQFRGKGLPAKTRLVDVTAQCHGDVLPSVYPDDGVTIGHGTQAALALAAAAPEAELTLIRIDAEAPYQLLAVARYLRGEPVRSECLLQRREELASDNNSMEVQRTQLLLERSEVLDNFKQDQATIKRREAYFQKQAELDKQSEELQKREQRYLQLAQDLLALQGTRVVACGLVWSDGYPVDGGSVLSQYFDTRPSVPLWFQTVSNNGGQVWAGLFRDTEGNGVMEFAPPGRALRPGRWTSELNFLGWQPLSGSVTAALPKGRFRVSVQWREPHDPAVSDMPGDPYRIPLANLRTLILRQRDPSGTKLPTDDLAVVANSIGIPLRLASDATSALYEQTVEFTVDEPGNYALRIEGKVPRTARPASEPTLPSQEIIWELWPRIFVDALDEAARASGRSVFLDYASSLGTLGMPADARHLVSVGAADRHGIPESFTSGGPALGQALHVKPDVYVPEIAATSGSGVATAFAAGAAACALGARVPADAILQGIRGNPGTLLRLP